MLANWNLTEQHDCGQCFSTSSDVDDKQKDVLQAFQIISKQINITSKYVVNLNFIFPVLLSGWQFKVCDVQNVYKQVNL